MLLVILWSTATSHTDDVNQDELEPFDKWADAFVEKCSRATITMSVNQFWLVVSATNDGSDCYIFFIVLANLNIFNNDKLWINHTQIENLILTCRKIFW